MVVPFKVGETVYELGDFTDRADEVARVRRAIRHCERLIVYGERRMGKSSLLRRAAAREREEHGATVLWLDLWSLTTVGDMLRALLRAIPWSWGPMERLRTLLAGADVRPTLTSGPSQGDVGLALGWSARQLSDGRARELLRSTVEALNTLASDRAEPVVIVLDEFQEVESLTGQGGRFLRGIVQDTGSLGYLLAGSTLALIDRLVAPRGAFYNTPRLDVGPIGRHHMEPWIEERMATHGVVPDSGLGGLVLDMAGPTTEARIRLARETFVIGMHHGRVGRSDVESAFRQIVDSSASGYEIIWSGLAEGQRRTLQILSASEPQPTAAHTLDRYGVNSSSTVVKAIEVLRRKAILSALDPPRVADPFFAAWIEAQTTPPGSAGV